MQLQAFSHWVEWVEHKTKPIFVGAALLLYGWSLIQLGMTTSPITELDAFLVGALANLSIPFGIILLQEMLELVANIGESTLLSARHQFEIILLVLVRSFFKKFDKVSGYVQDGELTSTVQEAIIKIVAIVILMFLIFYFRRMAESKYIRNYTGDQRINQYKQVLVVFLSLFVLGNMLFVTGGFEDITFISLVFTGIIIIDAIFLILTILQDKQILMLAFDSSLIIALIFVRFPLFATNILSVTLSVIGVAFATTALYLVYRVANFVQAVPGEQNGDAEGMESAH